MVHSKVFQSGNSQAVRIPKQYRLTSVNVDISKQGETLIIRAQPSNLSHAFTLLTTMPTDFFADGRQDSDPQARAFFA